LSSIGCFTKVSPWVAKTRSVNKAACEERWGEALDGGDGASIVAPDARMDGDIGPSADDHLPPALLVAQSRGTSGPVSAYAAWRQA
jgi:hypothetical protein